jgi:hypothetical protein
MAVSVDESETGWVVLHDEDNNDGDEAFTDMILFDIQPGLAEHSHARTAVSYHGMRG